MKKNIVYILGLSHVGSTLVDLVLGNLPNCVGLGEIYQLLRPGGDEINRSDYCSCGKTAVSCAFWGNVHEIFQEKQFHRFSVNYGKVIDRFDQLFGKETILVDSSKLLKPLQNLFDENRYEIKVIYLIRDVRAWSISRLDSTKYFPDYFSKDGHYIQRLKDHYGSKVELIKWLLPFLTRTAGYFFWIWYLQNRAYKKFLVENQIKFLQISYDELGMNTEQIVSKIHRFLGCQESLESFSTESSKSHILVGNIKKTDRKRRKTIGYDNRWLYRKEWLLSAFIFRKIMEYNNREVYKNIRQDSIW